VGVPCREGICGSVRELCLAATSLGLLRKSSRTRPNCIHVLPTPASSITLTQGTLIYPPLLSPSVPFPSSCPPEVSYYPMTVCIGDQYCHILQSCTALRFHCLQYRLSQFYVLALISVNLDHLPCGFCVTIYPCVAVFEPRSCAFLMRSHTLNFVGYFRENMA
jgi:hypothetical protein